MGISFWARQIDRDWGRGEVRFRRLCTGMVEVLLFIVFSVRSFFFFFFLMGGRALAWFGVDMNRSYRIRGNIFNFWEVFVVMVLWIRLCNMHTVGAVTALISVLNVETGALDLC